MWQVNYPEVQLLHISIQNFKWCKSEDLLPFWNVIYLGDKIAISTSLNFFLCEFGYNELNYSEMYTNVEVFIY